MNEKGDDPQTSVHLPLENSAHAQMMQRYHICTIIMSWLILSICIMGIMGNLLSLLIYCKPPMRSPINVLLAGLSVIDLFLVIFSIPTFVLPGFYAYYCTAKLKTIMSYTAVYIYPFTLTMQTASVWTFVIITVERWQTVCRPGHRHSPSIRRSLLALIFVCILAAGYNSVRFLEFRLDSVPNPTTPSNSTFPVVSSECDLNDGVNVESVLRNSTVYPFYMNFYYIGMFLVTHFVAPFAVLVVLNGFIIATICKSRRRRRSLNRGERREHRTAIMMITVMATFIVCYTLLFSLNLMEALDADWFYDESNMVLAFALNDLSNLLIVSNASSTIVVYYNFSGKYRFMLLQILSKVCPCFDLRSCILQRKGSMMDDETGTNKKESTTAGVHALFLLADRTSRRSTRCGLRERTESRKGIQLRNYDIRNNHVDTFNLMLH